MANLFHLKNRITCCYLMVFVVACGIDTKEKQKSNQQISYVILGSSQSGYTYQIFISEKLFIDQIEIPAVGGLQKFGSSEEAEMVAKLVMNKLNGKSRPPSVTINELDSLGITYDKTPLP